MSGATPAPRPRSRSPRRNDSGEVSPSQPRRILVTGSHGFIAGYTIPMLLDQGHEVYGIDNFWKYGKLRRSFDEHPRFHFTFGDAKDVELMRKIVFDNKIEIFVAFAAII
mmetsp:Transcript_614/g.2067  ORF Transcript_614/g.2067 Transcript_614/m.2067 type:complete len:110 (+) Transcript_614:48-377(+)